MIIRAELWTLHNIIIVDVSQEVTGWRRCCRYVPSWEHSSCLWHNCYRSWAQLCRILVTVWIRSLWCILQQLHHSLASNTSSRLVVAESLVLTLSVHLTPSSLLMILSPSPPAALSSSLSPSTTSTCHPRWTPGCPTVLCHMSQPSFHSSALSDCPMWSLMTLVKMSSDICWEVRMIWSLCTCLSRTMDTSSLTSLWMTFSPPTVCLSSRSLFSRTELWLWYQLSDSSPPDPSWELLADSCTGTWSPVNSTHSSRFSEKQSLLICYKTLQLYKKKDWFLWI